MMRRMLLLISSVAILGGCAYVQNKREAHLMPKEVAEGILVTHFGKAWVENPWGIIPPSILGCGNAHFPLPISEIRQVVTVNPFSVVVGNGKIGYPCGNSPVWAIRRDTAYTKQEVDDIVDALVSLGAKIDEVK